MCRRLVPRFEALLARAVSADVPLRVAVVGAGAAGVELACALQYRCAGAGWQQLPLAATILVASAPECACRAAVHGTFMP